VAKRITIQLVGAKNDQGDVRLGDFVDQLSVIKKALFERERLVSRTEQPQIDYKIVGLRRESPATIVLEPIALNGTRGYAEKVVAGFSRELRLIRREAKIVDEPDVHRLEAYRRIGHRSDNLIAKVKIAVGKSPVTIDHVFKENVDKILGPDELVEGTISGMLEAVNFHNANKFTLYPPIGARKINGTFDPTLRPKIKEAIGNFVTVLGKLRYKQWSPFPHGMIAEDVDIHEPDASLPSLSELRGAFAGITGDRNSVEFVDTLRDESW